MAAKETKQDIIDRLTYELADAENRAESERKLRFERTAELTHAVQELQQARITLERSNQEITALQRQIRDLELEATNADGRLQELRDRLNEQFDKILERVR